MIIKKRCRVCNDPKVLDEFYRNYSGSHGRLGICKKCNLKYRRKERVKIAAKKALEKHSLNKTDTKECECCLRERPIKKFEPVKYRTNSTFKKCIECMQRIADQAGVTEADKGKQLTGRPRKKEQDEDLSQSRTCSR